MLDQLLAIRSEDPTEASTWRFGIFETHKLTPFSTALILQDLTRQDHKRRSFHGHDLAQASIHFTSDMVLPSRNFVLGGFVPDQRPRCHVNVDVLSVLVVAEQRLTMLPAIQTSNLAERRRHNTLQGVGLSVAEVCTLDVSRLDLAAVVGDGACWVDKGLILQSDGFECSERHIVN